MDENTKAKLYFQEAERLFNQNYFKDAITYLDKADEALGTTNGRILNLRIKSLYNSGDFIEAEKAINLFVEKYSETVTPELKSETLSYFVRIEKGAEAKREEAAKKEAFEKCKCSTCGGSGQVQNSRIEETSERETVACPYCYFGKDKYGSTCHMCNGSGQRQDWKKKRVYYSEKCTWCGGDGCRD